MNDDAQASVIGLRNALEQARAELAAARAAHQQVETILESITDGVAVLNGEGTITWVNRLATVHAMMSREELVGQNLWTLFPQIATSDVFERWQWARREQKSVALEYQDNNGAWWSINIYPAGMDATFYVQEITRRKRAETTRQFIASASQLLAGSLDYEAVLQTIVELPLAGFADLCFVDLVNENGEIDRVAGAHRDPSKYELVEALFPFSPAKFASEGPAKVLRTGVPSLVAEISDSWLMGISRSDEHLRVMRALAPRSAMIIPLLARGRTIGALTIVDTAPNTYDADCVEMAQNLASRAALALDNARLYRDSLRARRIRDEVLSIVAHDLRNPLATISLNTAVIADILDSEDEPRSNGTRPLASIQRSVERASRIIADLLDMAAMEADKLRITMMHDDPAAMLEEVVVLHEPLAMAQGIALRAEIPDELDEAYVDRDRIVQVFSNLIDNALRFTPSGGCIIVAAEDVANELRLCVSDTGPGICEANIAHVFEPFWQADDGPSQGAGLGLSIAQGIVRAHGGRMWVESPPGKGCTFWFTLPRSR